MIGNIALWDEGRMLDRMEHEKSEPKQTFAQEIASKNEQIRIELRRVIDQDEPTSTTNDSNPTPIQTDDDPLQ